MDTIMIGGVTFELPDIDTDIYSGMQLQEVITGLEDFDRIDAMGGDWLESECFEAYARHHNIDEGDAPIDEVRESTFAWYSDYKGEDHELILLVPVK